MLGRQRQATDQEEPATDERGCTTHFGDIHERTLSVMSSFNASPSISAPALLIRLHPRLLAGGWEHGRVCGMKEPSRLSLSVRGPLIRATAFQTWKQAGASRHTGMMRAAN